MNKFSAGIALRWVLGTMGEDETVYLIAQALPVTLGVIDASQELLGDQPKGWRVGTFPVAYNRFDGKRAAGPVPIFCSVSPDATLKALQSSPEYAFECLQMLVRRLLVREEITR